MKVIMKLNEKWTLFLIATFVTFFGIADTLLKGTKAMEDGSTNEVISDINTIDSYSLDVDSSLIIDKDNKYIKYIEEDTTVDYLLSKVNVIGASVEVYSIDGKIKDNNDILATGDSLVIYVYNEVKDNYVISVIGDYDSDGVVGLIDLVQMRKHIAELENLDTSKLEIKKDIYYYSLDFNQDEDVDLIDLVRMRKVVAGIDDNEKN